MGTGHTCLAFSVSGLTTPGFGGAGVAEAHPALDVARASGAICICVRSEAGASSRFISVRVLGGSGIVGVQGGLGVSAVTGNASRDGQRKPAFDVWQIFAIQLHAAVAARARSVA